ncbi:MAG: proline--tRNA ligase [Fusobacteriales bacterium]|jgi:prolyl-tRNA synthetase|nr:proline--tRNA ligase [Fusobacteriales bacterium]
MRLSKAFVKTYKEAPKEAEVISHKLMLRASMIKRLASGVYSYLPLGNRVLKKVENIVREEMDKSGAQEVFMPVLQPADLWKESGRWVAYGPELMRMKDRHEREFALGPTHEEVITDIVRNEINSYKDLPMNLYQIQTKFRDEIRPRFGLMRGREFIMKDAYSFHTTHESLDEEYLNMKTAYENIFTRCGLDFRAVEADSGSIGGDVTHEFMVLAESGEDDILYCDSCDYAANKEKAASKADFKESDEEAKSIELVETPNTWTIEDVAAFFNIPVSKTVKVVVLKEAFGENDKYYMALIRGDYEVNTIKVKNLVNAAVELEMINDADMEKLDLVKGFIGPAGLNNKNIKIVMDESVKFMKNFTLGPNKKDHHYINSNISDFKYDMTGDIREAKEGEKCPRCGGTLKIARGIEVGHIFELGTKYSEAMKANVLDENGKQTALKMGCYGIGVSRIMSAAIEQNHDENGIIWPVNIAPYEVDIIIPNIKDENQVRVAEDIYQLLKDHNIDVILDDRDERAGFKFKDADLIGFPLKIITGKSIAEGKAEVKDRKTGKTENVEIVTLLDYVKNHLGK